MEIIIDYFHTKSALPSNVPLLLNLLQNDYFLINGSIFALSNDTWSLKKLLMNMSLD